MDIREAILLELEKIEKQHCVRILHAVESGSRAWGFASPDSDYDVRFIYVRPAEDYIRIDEIRDVIEWKLDQVLDINGWDLKKAMRQFARGNATCMSGAIPRLSTKQQTPGIIFVIRPTIISQKKPLFIIIMGQL